MSINVSNTVWPVAWSVDDFVGEEGVVAIERVEFTYGYFWVEKM